MCLVPILSVSGSTAHHSHQSEKVYPDGRREVRFPDGTVKTVQPTGEEESLFSDGTVQRQLVDGSREIRYPNGQREMHTQDFKVCRVQ